MTQVARKSVTTAVLLLLMLGAGVAQGQDQASPARIDRLRTQIERLLRRADGKVGVAVKHLESGQGLNVDGEILFPMASAFKVPVLVELLYQVKEGRYKLEDDITVQKSDQHVGSGMISNLVMPGMTISVLILICFQDETKYGTVSLWQDHEELTIT